MSLRNLIFGMGAAVLVACTGAASDDAATSGEDVTNTLETSVRNQKDTGNCWLFATAGWAESLELSALVQEGQATADDPSTYPGHLSPAYWDYWDWYVKITTGQVKGGRTKQDLEDMLDTGGSWGAAVEIIASYGMVRSADFVGKADGKDADVAEAALGVMGTSLQSGALKTVAARQNKTLVRQELDRAFGISDAISAQLTAAFGADGSGTFDHGGATGNDLVIDPSTYQVRVPTASGSYQLLPITETIGTRASGDDPDQRVGDHAWQVTAFTPGTDAQNRAYLKRVQKAMNMGVPLPISWYVASNGDPDNDGEYVTTPSGPADADESGGHETLLDDYDVTNVPGYGHLAAGTPATDAQKNAALADSASVTFLRVKNSWGTRGKSVAPKGYNDLYLDYLIHPIEVCPKGTKSGSSTCTHEVPLEDVTLPAGF